MDSSSLRQLVVSAAQLGAGEVGVAGVAKALRWVCLACRGVYFAPVNGRCPGCKGEMKEQQVEFDAAGVALLKDD